MKICVTGGRDYDNYATVTAVLDKFHQCTPITLLIEGGAAGADRLCRLWAINNNVPFTTVNAEWQRHGRQAGPIRNERMLAWYNPDILIAFPGGKGTRHCIDAATRRGIKVMEVSDV